MRSANKIVSYEIDFPFPIKAKDLLDNAVKLGVWDIIFRRHSPIKVVLGGMQSFIIQNVVHLWKN